MGTLALCIPAYNAEAYLPRLLTSATNQHIPFDEILVYNDCSTDDTAHIAEKYGARVISGDVNKGCSTGKNILAENTSCDWIHFHDADDDLLPDFTIEVHNWINEFGQTYDILLLNFNFVDFKTGVLLGGSKYNKEELHHDALKYAINNKIVNFAVYKTAKFIQAGGFDLDTYVLYNEDNALHQRLAKHPLKFDCLDKVTCINYYYPVSMSTSNKIKCARATYYVLAKTAATHGHIYPFELAAQLWNCATILAAEQDWAYVKKSLFLSKKLGYSTIPQTNLGFRLLSYTDPYVAVWIREKLIRLLKPHLREK